MLHLALLRGINVGGKNPVPMARLRACLEADGAENVRTYIASGNVIFESRSKPTSLGRSIERSLLQNFSLHSELIKVLVLTQEQVRSVVDDAPPGFGAEPGTYHCDAIFPMGVSTDDLMPIFSPRDGVDQIWPGERAVYSQRLSAQRTKSRLGKITESPLYQSLTIRSWQTTIKLRTLMDDAPAVR